MALDDAANEKFLTDYDALPGVKKTDSGLRYQVVTEGPAGGKSPSARSNVTVHYKGTFIDGREFDSSYKRNSPATFGLHQVISGWTEGVQLMKEGDTFEFAIPYDLAYGERGGGSIPPRQTLVFQVELLKVA
jgi:FKBP-type peptidyl-prolyl cis-trans isomerase FklB